MTVAAARQGKHRLPEVFRRYPCSKRIRGIERPVFLIDPDRTPARGCRKLKVAGHPAEVLEAVTAL